MWSEYGPLGMLVEHRKLPSFGGSDSAQDIYKPYVVNDIMTFFTLLVGIYFPSVTGETLIKVTARPTHIIMQELVCVITAQCNKSKMFDFLL